MSVWGWDRVVLVYNIYKMTFSELDAFIVKFLLGLALCWIVSVLFELALLMKSKRKQNNFELEQWKISSKV